MKRFCYLCVLVFLPLLASADAVNINGISYNLDADAKTAEVTAENPGMYAGGVVIPETVTYNSVVYSVTSIASYAFFKCRELTAVTIPKSIKTIGSRAFDLYYDPRLSIMTAVYISDLTAWCDIFFEDEDANPLSYGRHLFVEGKEIKDLVIPDGVTTIKQCAFTHCEGLTSVTIPNSVTEIGLNAFSKCSALVSVSIPNSVTSISGFSRCTGLTSIEIPNSVVTIGDYAFHECTGLTSIDIPNSVTSIGYQAFSGCTGLTSIDLPNSVTSIGTLAFGDCTGLTSIVIPNSVTSIGNAFSGCTSLTSLEISNSVTEIVNETFQGCYRLRSVILPNSVKWLGDHSFGECRDLTDIYWHAEQLPDLSLTAFENSFSQLITLHVPENLVDSYKANAPWKYFKDIVPLSESDAPIRDSLSYNRQPVEIDGICYRLIPKGNAVEVVGKGYSGDLVIPGEVEYKGSRYSVVSIDDSFGSYGEKITSVTIPNSVTNIDAWAFARCAGLTSLTLPDNLITIGHGAFYYCTGLTSMTIPDKVYAMDEMAFYGCSGLTSITLPDGLAIIGSSAFQSCCSLTSVKIPKSVAVINLDTFGDCSSLASVSLPDGLLSIRTGAFSGCTSLSSIIIPDGVGRVWSSTFSDCTSLASVTIGSNIREIDYKAFANCTGLKEIYCRTKYVPQTQADAFMNVSQANVTLHVPTGSADAYKESESWQMFTIVEDVEVPDDGPDTGPSGDNISITISNARQLPFFCDQALDFSGLEEKGVKAYMATAYDKSDGKIWLTRVKKVPAYMGILITGEPGSYDVPLAGDVDVFFHNLLQGNVSATTIPEMDESGATNYYLSNGTEGIGFYKVNGSQDLKANRSYLTLWDPGIIGAEGDPETIEISKYEQLPYYSSNSLDFTELESQGVKAYISPYYEYKSGTILLSRVKKVPAFTGILVKGPEGKYSVPTIASQDICMNIFEGTLEATTIYGEDDWWMYYYLSNGIEGIGYYKASANGTYINSNRSYLKVPYRTSVSAARGESVNAALVWNNMVLSDDDDDVIAIPVFGGDATGISDVHQRVEEQEVYYNLQGLRVDKPGKGVFIRNGKKVVIK